VPFPSLSSIEVCALLAAEAGLRTTPDAVQIEAREDRWLARLPEQRLAFAAAPYRARPSLPL
jgi:hypothetical protein